MISVIDHDHFHTKGTRFMRTSGLRNSTLFGPFGSSLVASTSLIVLLLSGCASDSQQQTNPGQTVPGKVEATKGGSVSSADGKVVLTIPPNALSSDTVFSIGPGNGAPASTRLLGNVIEIEPNGTNFQVPAQLTLPLPAGIPQSVDLSTLKVGTVENGQWVELSGTPVISQANGTISVQITHLSLYAVLQPPPDEPTNQVPTAAISGPSTGTAGLSLAFNGSGSSDPDGDTLSYAWTFGDGQSATGASVTHTYTAATSYTVTLTVSDGRGGSGEDSRNVIISAAGSTNLPPTAKAKGPSVGTVGQNLPFTDDGSTDPNPGDQLSYNWTFGDGTSDSGASVTHQYNDPGTYTVTLTVSDGHGLSAQATTLTVTISAPGSTNLPPTAIMTGPTAGTVGQVLTFSDNGSSDPNGDQLTFAWTFGDGVSGNTASVTHSYTTANTFTVTLTVSDGRGGSDSDSRTVTITAVPPTNQPPTAVITGPATGITGQSLTFSGTSSSDPNNDPLTYAWTVDSASVGSNSTLTRTFTTTGNHTVGLTVSDGRGGSNSNSLTVAISPAPNQPPIAVVNGPYVGVVNQLLTFSSTGSRDPENGALTYSWNFGDGTTAAVASPTHAYSSANTFTVTLTVTDSGGLSALASTTATISQPAPNQLPTISTTTIPATGLVLQNMVFNAAASDPDGDVLTYRWDFGDGSLIKSGPTAPVLHEFSSAQTYTVTLTVDDGRGGVATASGTITISLPAGPVAFPRSLFFFPRLVQPPAHLSRYVIELDGSGVPPLQFKITSFPRHLDPAVNNSMNVATGTYYQWYDALGLMRLDCRKTTGPPIDCKTTTSTQVDLTPDPVTGLPNGTLTVNPAGSPPYVGYYPQLCDSWIGPLGDSFSYTVTDATGATSAPATIDLAEIPNVQCPGRTL